VSRVGAALGAWPGRIESVGHVKRRLLVVAAVAALAIGGTYAVLEMGPSAAPFTDSEVRDLSGLPEPPVRFVQEDNGSLRQLTPQELEQLQQLNELIRNFPAPDIFVQRPGAGGKGATRGASEGGSGGTGG
jgi:hypothetical protein